MNWFVSWHTMCKAHTIRSHTHTYTKRRRNGARQLIKWITWIRYEKKNERQQRGGRINLYSVDNCAWTKCIFERDLSLSLSFSLRPFRSRTLFASMAWIDINISFIFYYHQSCMRTCVAESKVRFSKGGEKQNTRTGHTCRPHNRISRHIFQRVTFEHVHVSVCAKALARLSVCVCWRASDSACLSLFVNNWAPQFLSYSFIGASSLSDACVRLCVCVCLHGGGMRRTIDVVRRQHEKKEIF